MDNRKETIQYKTLEAEIFNVRFWLNNTNPSWLKTTFEQLLTNTNYKILNFSEHFFPTRGYTAIWLLAESHLAIHSFPNKKWSYIELSSVIVQKTSNS